MSILSVSATGAPQKRVPQISSFFRCLDSEMSATHPQHKPHKTKKTVAPQASSSAEPDHPVRDTANKHDFSTTAIDQTSSLNQSHTTVSR